jgi:Ca2+-binding EF-hand superfamily protein
MRGITGGDPSDCPFLSSRGLGGADAAGATEADAAVDSAQAADGGDAAEEGAVSRLGPGSSRWEAMTALQKHVAFFDGNADATITIDETEAALREIGMGDGVARPAAVFINVGLSKQTTGKLGLTVDMDGILGGMHSGDSKSYDAKGMFDPEKLDEMFQTFDVDGDGGLDEIELDDMIKTRTKSFSRNRMAARSMFLMLHELAGEEVTGTNGGEARKVLTPETMRSFYEGDLFYDIAQERKDAGLEGHAKIEGAAGFAKHFGNIVGGPAAGAKAAAIMTTIGGVFDSIGSAITGAMRAVCPNLGG